VFALAGQFGLELRPVFLDDLVEQGRFGPMPPVCGWVRGCQR